MQLTQKQEWLIDRYVRAVEHELIDMPAAVRERAAAHVRSKVEESVAHIPTPRFSDADLAGIFQQLGSPSQMALVYRHKYGRDRLMLAQYGRVWLGVCGGIARYLGLNVKQVRWAAVLLGITGPVALLVYLALYFEMYLNTPEDAVPRLDVRRMVSWVGLGAAATVALDVGTRLAVIPFDRLFETVLSLSVPDFGRWDWLDGCRAALLGLTLVNALPLFALAATPMADNWDQTLGKVGKCVLAIYALVLSSGVACHLAALLIAFVQKAAWI